MISQIIKIKAHVSATEFVEFNKLKNSKISFGQQIAHEITSSLVKTKWINDELDIGWVIKPPIIAFYWINFDPDIETFAANWLLTSLQ